MSELTKRSFLNFVTSILKSIGLMALTFIMTPVLLRLIGPADFGTFKVLTEVVNYLSILEMGLYASLMTCLFVVIKNKDSQKLERIISEGWRRYFKVTLLSLLIGLMFLPFLKKMTSWNNESDWDLYLTYLMILSTVALMPTLIYKAYLDSSNRGDLVNLVVFFQNLFFIIFGLFFANLGWKLKSQGMAVMLSGIIGAILFRYVSKLKIKPTKEKDEEFGKQIVRYQKPQFFNGLAEKLSQNCDQLIIVFFIGPVTVTKVFLGQRVVQIVQGQLQSIGLASWASLSSLYHDREINNGLFEKRILEVTKILSCMSIASLVPVCILNQTFIGLWVGDSYLMETNTLTLLASANAFFWTLFSFWQFTMTVLGKPAEITRMIWIQAVVNVIASITFTKLWGGIGPIAGTLLSYILVPLWFYPKLMLKNFKIAETRLLSSFALPGLIGILCVVLYHYSPWKFHSLNWITFILSGIMLFGVLASFLFIVLFNEEEKKLFLGRIRGLWEKFSRRFS